MNIRLLDHRHFLVKSGSQRGVWYETTWSAGLAQWTCTCKAGQYGRRCSHIRAVSFISLAKSKGITLKQVADGVGWKIEC